MSKYKSTEILFHHRYPTSTSNTKRTAHPFSTKDHFDTNYVLVHNGVVSNARSLFLKHRDMGITYSSLQLDGSFNDSEALLWDVALYLEGKQDGLTAEGSIAFICMALSDSNDMLYFARNYGSPLKLKQTNASIFISSEGKGSEVEAHKLHCYNYETRKLIKTALRVPTTNYYTPNTGHTHTPEFAGATPYYDFDDTEWEDYPIDEITVGDVTPELSSLMDLEEELIDPQTIRQDIRAKYDEYMKAAKGSFKDALDACLADIRYYKAELAEERLGNGEEDLLTLYFSEITKGVAAVIMAHDKNVLEDSVDTNYYFTDDAQRTHQLQLGASSA